VPTSRIGHKLEAVSKDSEVATQKILAAAEDIDQAADNLAAALKDGIDRGLARTSGTASCRFSRPAISRTSPASA
jgi:hypothetical protein